MQSQEIFDAISPLREMAAYEVLWDMPHASVKKISEIIFKNKDVILSQLVCSKTIDSYVKELKEIIFSKSPNFETSFVGEADYPKKLFDAKHPTPLLYYIGAWDLIFSPSIAIVGTGNPKPEIIRRTRHIVKKLVQDNFTIASGLSKGIDTVVHEAAIANRGRTIGIIGTPINLTYPKENSNLQTIIASKYLLVSQVPFIRYYKQNYIKNSIFFTERNKTMSALTLGTLIVEIDDTPDLLIQAEAALYQKRKLFILDSCCTNKKLTWPMKLLERGAVLVKNYSEIRNSLCHETSTQK